MGNAGASHTRTVCGTGRVLPCYCHTMSPQAAPRPCCKVGCPNYAKHRGYCDVHKSYASSLYDKTRRSATDRGYNARWRRVRARQLARQPFCEECGQGATEVHHRTAILKGGAKYAPSNLESICRSCHQRLTARGE